MSAIVTFIWKIIVFLFGLSNVFPSKINLYQVIVKFVLSEITPETTFYSIIIILAAIFWIIIIILTLKQLKETIDYGSRYAFN